MKKTNLYRRLYLPTLLTITLLSAGGCFTADGGRKAKNLDIPLTTKKPAGSVGDLAKGAPDAADKSGDKSANKGTNQAPLKAGISGATSGVAEHSVPEGQKIDAVAVMDWQKFFKPAPNADQRRQIHVLLSKWKEEDSAEAILKKARLQLAVGLIEDAEASFRQMLRIDSDNAEVLLDLATLYLRKRALDKAFDYIEQAQRYIAASEEAPYQYRFRYRFVLAQGLLARGENKSGRAILSDLIAHDKGFVPAYAVLANSYISQGKLALAEFVALRGLDRGKEDAWLVNIIGVIAQKQGETTKADTWIARALEVDPNYAPALVNRANLAISRAYYESGEEDLKKAIAIAPDSVTAHISLGILYKRTGRFDLAKNALSKAIDIDPESSYARFNMGMLMLDTFKEPNEALRFFHETLQTGDNDADVKEMAQIQIKAIRESRT